MKSEPLGHIRVLDDKITFGIDPAQSFLAGWIAVDTPDHITWSIEVTASEDAAIEPPDNESADEAQERMDLAGFLADQGCQLEMQGLEFPVSQWRDLAGLTAAVDFNSADVHPILPDNPGNFYYATEHHVPEHSRITIGQRRGNQFHVLCRFQPQRYAGEVGGEAEVDALIPLREICVYFADVAQVSEEAARACAARFAADGDLGPATTDRNWVRLAINPDAP